MAENTASRTFLIVLGMHRSGTSALAGTLGILGATLPDDLVGKHPFNVKGHFESKSIKRIDEEMLRAIGSAWYDLRSISPECLETEIVAQAKAKLKEAIQRHYGMASLLVLKDPRLCRSFPVIRSVIDEHRASVHVIFCFRNPLDVARSLEARDGIALQHGLGLWLRHMLDGEFHSRGLQRVFVDFSDFLQDWRTTIKRIEQRLGISLPTNETSANAVEEFVDARLRHHSASIAELKTCLGKRVCVHCYETFGALVSNPNDEEAMRQLDRIRDEFERASILGEAVQEYYAQILATKSVETQLAEIKTQHALIEVQLADSQAQLADSHAQLTHSKVQHALVKEQAKEVEARLVNTEEKMRAMKRSWSWRVTKPFRSFAMFMRWMKKTVY